MKRKKGQQIEMFAAPAPEPMKAAPEVQDLTPQAEKLLANFEVFSQAEGGVKKLRELVLELAACGRLAPNDSAPMPNKPEGSTRIGHYVTIQNGYAFKSEWFISEGVRLARNVNIMHGSLKWDEKACVSTNIAADYERFALAEGDILISLDRPIIATGIKVARVQHNDLPCLLLQRVGRVQFKGGELLSEFFFLWLRSPCFTRVIDPGRSKGVPHISSKEIEAIPFTPPSIQAQRQNVSLADELMKLCDELETRQAKQRETGARLTKSALDALAQAEGPEELATAWERVVGNFEGLVSRPDDVKKVRETVLSLAVRGRLVEQDPGDEPSNPKNNAILNNDALTHPRQQIPRNWIWVQLDSILKLLRNGTAVAPISDVGIPILRISALRPNNVNINDVRHLPGVLADYQEFILCENDLLFTRYSGNAEFVGICGVVPPLPRPMIHPDKLIRGQLDLDCALPAYVSLAINTGDSRRYIRTCARTTAGQVGISGKQIKLTPIPLPPLAEQKRIVAKVDQLMCLCDELEAQLRLAEETSRKVAEALVAELLKA